MKIQFLSENRVSRPECLAEHGLSVYIEISEKKILFDLGASDIYLQNAKSMGIDLDLCDAAVISHGHYDHTGGVPSFCKLNQTAKVYIHEKAFETTFGMEDGKLEKAPCSIRWTSEQKKELMGRLTLINGPFWLSDDIVISGTIPKPSDYQPTEAFFLIDEAGNLTIDPMEHEQFLAVRVRDTDGVSKGIFVFSGCSHNGVIPCISYAKVLFPGEKLFGLLAGMHLYNAGKELRSKVLGQIAAEEIGSILPVHCTGIRAICDLRQLIGDRCIPAGTGDVLEF
jgi:7,8-dihydropterin-6-yl-methyl-4-(beta-D-ribofuranosyl)aminobenzene 5'-phosphate synthase